MKRWGVFAVTSVGLSVLVVGCGSAGVSTTPAQTPLPTHSPSTTPARKAGIGDTIDLSNGTSGTHIAVTVARVVDPDSPSNEFEMPFPGDRYESIQFRIINVGTGTYQDDPLIEASAKDAAGQSMKEAIVTSTIAGPQMPSSVNLAPGDTALGYVTFNVPIGEWIAQVQYSVNLGVTGTTGEWQIAKSQTQTQPPAAPSSAGQATPPAAPITNSAQTVVEQYFAAINAGNYARAWALGGKNIEHGSYNSFVQGFAGTASDSVTVVSVSGDTVTVELDATQTDGTHKYFAGTYTVKNGLIVAADIH